MSYFAYPKYDDQSIVVQAASGVSALTTEGYREAGRFLMTFFRHNQDDAFYATLQMPHRKKLGSALASVHLHLIPMIDPSSSPEYAYFSTNYAWVLLDGTLAAPSNWTNSLTQFAVTTGDAFKHKYHPLVTNVAAPGSETYSSILLLEVSRLGSSGGANDTYKTNKAAPGTVQANLGVLSVDAHVLMDRLGSHLEGSD
jgi:hypothetical protein